MRRTDRAGIPDRVPTYPSKPSIFASLLETRSTQNTLRPDHHESIFVLNNWFKITTVLFCALHSPVTYIYICNHALNWNVFKNRYFCDQTHTFRRRVCDQTHTFRRRVCDQTHTFRRRVCDQTHTFRRTVCDQTHTFRWRVCDQTHF